MRIMELTPKQELTPKRFWGRGEVLEAKCGPRGAGSGRVGPSRAR